MVENFAATMNKTEKGGLAMQDYAELGIKCATGPASSATDAPITWLNIGNMFIGLQNVGIGFL